MVSDRTVDRAQLILVGSLLVALVIIGLALVLNAVIFTESIDSTATTADATAATEFDDTVTRDTRSLLVRVNHGGVYADNASLDAAIRANYSAYSGLLTETYASGRGAVADTVYNGATVNGSRTIQTTDGAFTQDGTGSGQDDWSLVSASNKRALGWFVVNLNASEMSQTPVAFELVGSSGETRRIEIRQNTSSDSRVDVETELLGTSDTSRDVCTASRERVLLDMLEGEAVVGNCRFDTTEGLTGPYAVRVVDGDEARGTYELVTKAAGNGALPNCPVASGPCTARVVWQANVTTVYESSTIEYHRTGTITIYDTP